MSTDAARAPGRPATVALVVVGFWLAFGLLESAKMVLSFRMRGEPIGWAASLLYNLPWWLVWAALTPAVVAACRWLGPGARPPGLRLLGHLPVAAAVCLVHLVVISAQTHVTAPRGPLPRAGLVEHTWRMIDGYLMLDLLTYAGVVAACLAWQVYRRYHDQRGAALSLALRTSELEKHLVDAELSALRMELNPHFLFNTLNSVAGLVRRGDGERAVDVLADLGDLLRATLDSSRRPEVALAEELGLVERYLAIEGVRFADRLEVRIDVEPEAREASVPSMILQPLVENALRHGIAHRPGAGRDLGGAAGRQPAPGGRRLGPRLRRAGAGRRRDRAPQHGVAAARPLRRARRPAGGRQPARRRGRLDHGAVRAGGGAVVSRPLVRVLIVDDEPLARDCVRLPLAARDDVEIAGEHGDGAAAVAHIVADPPDLVFLDVQMPGLDGFEVVERVGADRMPPLVFVTAHGQHAVRAFEVHALHYLMKPFTTARLHAAFEHARSRLPSWHDDETPASLRRLRGGERAAVGAPPATRLLVRENDRFHFLAVADVLWFEACRNQVRAHVAAGSHLLSMSLGALAERLDPAHFVRCHRSSIVNLDAVREIQAWFGGDYIAVLVNGVKVRVSRTHRDAVLRPIA